MNTNKNNQEFKSLNTSELIHHSVLSLKTKAEKSSFLNTKIDSLMKSGTDVDLIVVSESPADFSAIIEKCLKQNDKTISYETGKEEFIGTVQTIESLIALRSFMFQSSGVKNWSEYNVKTNNACPAVEVCFDISGNEMWNDDNFSSFQSLNDLVKLSKDYGITMTFFNLMDCAQKMSLEIAVQ
jgi:hypothetical protein